VNTIRVLRLSVDVADRLRAAPPEAGRVHSVFDRALNLAWHDRRLLTLQGPGPLLAPFAAALTRLPPSGAVRPGARAWRLADTLAVDDVILEWRSAVVADTSMPESGAGPGRALSALRDHPQAETGAGLCSPLGHSARSLLTAGLRRRDAESFIEGARRLLGLGEGLTPAGDDCLVGTLAVVHRFCRSWLRGHPEIATSVGTAAAAATTAIAREFVSHALAGCFAESLIGLMTAESPEAAERAVTRVLGTGATSGADTLCGMRLALAALGPSTP